jgi:polysaccharide pyruvyl transferase CsaB
MGEKKKRRYGVIISGAYGMDNAGDDAVLLSILTALRSMDDQMPITVLARQPEKTACRFQVRAVHPFRFLRWLRAMGEASLFISGGGSLLQDVTSRRSLWYYLFTIRAAKGRGCRVMLYGCGVGPIKSQCGRRQTVKTLERCADVISLRDGDSGALLDDWGVRSSVICTADPAVSAAMSDGTRKPCIGIVLRPWRGVANGIPAFAAAAVYAYQRYGLQPVFFCLAPEDETAARQVAERLTDIPWRREHDWHRLSEMGMVLSMRLHGLVFSLAGGTPAAGVSYDPKVDGFCGEAGYPCVGLEQISEQCLRELIDRTMELDREEIGKRAGAMQEKERMNGELAQRLLRG